MKDFSSERALRFTESVIRDMTRVCIKHRGVNLAQGFPDFPAPAGIKEAAISAIREDFNQYAITWGTPALRQAIVQKFARYNGVEMDPEKEITVKPRTGWPKFEPITWPEVTGVALLGSVSLIVGLWPRVLLDTIEPAVKALLAGGGQ